MDLDSKGRSAVESDCRKARLSSEFQSRAETQGSRAADYGQRQHRSVDQRKGSSGRVADEQVWAAPRSLGDVSPGRGDRFGVGKKYDRRGSDGR